MLKQKGSIFYLEYTVLLQAVKITTTASSADVTIETAATHGLASDDTITVKNVEGMPFSGFSKSQIEGVRLLKTGTTGKDLVFTVTGSNTATQSSDLTTFLADIECTIYKSMDMHSSATSFTRSTTEPEGTYANNVAVA